VNRREWTVLAAIAAVALVALWFSGGLRPPEGPPADLRPGDHTRDEPGASPKLKI
jgi:hypothetical protein